MSPVLTSLLLLTIQLVSLSYGLEPASRDDGQQPVANKFQDQPEYQASFPASKADTDLREMFYRILINFKNNLNNRQSASRAEWPVQPRYGTFEEDPKESPIMMARPLFTGPWSLETGTSQRVLESVNPTLLGLALKKAAIDRQYKEPNGLVRLAALEQGPTRSKFRFKRRRCDVDRSLAVKNPSLCDTDAYFRLSEYETQHAWDAAGKRR